MSCVSIFSSATFWTAVGSIVAIVTLWFIGYQIKATRKISAADFLLRLEQAFSKELLDARKQLAKSIKEKAPDIDFELPDFFETLGLLLRHKVVDEELIWQTFSYWVRNYWILTESYITRMRNETKDKTFYTEFEYLSARMTELEKKKRKTSEIKEEELRKFIEEENNLSST